MGSVVPVPISVRKLDPVVIPDVDAAKNFMDQILKLRVGGIVLATDGLQRGKC
jgi:hypothetical protein